MILHSDCALNVNIECVKWTKQDQPVQIEYLHKLFPCFEPSYIRKVYLDSGDVEKATKQLLHEDLQFPTNWSRLAPQSPPVVGQAPIRMHKQSANGNHKKKKNQSWSELRQIDRTIREFILRLEEIDELLSKINRTPTATTLSDLTDNFDNTVSIETLQEEIECVENALAALSARRVQLVNDLKQTGLLVYYQSDKTEPPPSAALLSTSSPRAIMNSNHLSNGSSPRGMLNANSFRPSSNDLANHVPYSMPNKNVVDEFVPRSFSTSSRYFAPNLVQPVQEEKPRVLNDKRDFFNSAESLSSPSSSPPDSFNFPTTNSSSFLDLADNDADSNLSRNESSASFSSVDNSISNNTNNNSKQPEKVVSNLTKGLNSLKSTTAAEPQSQPPNPRIPRLGQFRPNQSLPAFNSSVSMSKLVEKKVFHSEQDEKKDVNNKVPPYKVIRYTEMLFVEIQKRTQNINGLRNKALVLRSSLLEELKIYADHCIPELRRPCIDRYFFEQYYYETRIAYQEAVIDALQNRAIYLQKILDKLSTGEDSVPASLIMGVRRLLSNDQVVSSRRLAIPQAERWVRVKTAQFTELKSQVLGRTSVSARKLRFADILDSRITDDTCPYPIDGNLFHEFRNILFDDRTLTGRWIRHAISTISSEDDPLPEDILQFLTEFLEDLNSEYCMQDTWFLRAFTDCAFFPPLHFHLMKTIDNERLQRLDKFFAEKIHLIKKIPAPELGLVSEYLSTNLTADLTLYKHTLDLLSDLPFLLTPIEILLCIAQAIETICLNTESLQKPDDFRSLSADDLLPILVFCVIHTDLVRPHLIVEFAGIFSDEIFKKGRLGYCFTTFEAAVFYISDYIEEHFISENGL